MSAMMVICDVLLPIAGSAAQAKAILCYLLAYVTKATHDVTESLPLLYHARRSAQENPSIAEDRDTAGRRGRLFLHKFLNDISGRVEVSSTMAALCVLGGEAEVFTDKFFFVFVTAAIGYVKRLLGSRA